METSGLVLTIIIIVLGIFDLAIVLIKGTGSSISQWLISRAFNAPLMVFAFGFVAGHLFGYMYVEIGPMSAQPFNAQVEHWGSVVVYLAVLSYMLFIRKLKIRQENAPKCPPR